MPTFTTPAPNQFQAMYPVPVQPQPQQCHTYPLQSPKLPIRLTSSLPTLPTATPCATHPPPPAASAAGSSDTHAHRPGNIPRMAAVTSWHLLPTHLETPSLVFACAPHQTRVSPPYFLLLCPQCSRVSSVPLDSAVSLLPRLQGPWEEACRLVAYPGSELPAPGGRVS